MTRSHKFTDRDHAGIAEGTADREARLPRYFAKAGHSDSDPTKTKKGGSGKGNWYVKPLLGDISVRHEAKDPRDYYRSITMSLPIYPDFDYLS